MKLISLWTANGENRQSLIASLMSAFGHRHLRIYVAQPPTQIIDFFELHNIRSESFPSLDLSLLPSSNIEKLSLIKSKAIQDFSQQDWNILDVRTSSVLTRDNPFSRDSMDSRDSRDTIQGI